MVFKDKNNGMFSIKYYFISLKRFFVLFLNINYSPNFIISRVFYIVHL